MAEQTPQEYKLGSESLQANGMLLGLASSVLILLLKQGWFAPFLLASGVWYVAYDILEKDAKRHENKLPESVRKKIQFSLVLSKIVVATVILQIAWIYFF